ncbi:hypothetical protein PG999_002042 [Apiospora kogelbergensis]|uniref:Geranylgeranyl pyrophosphate synthase n=1 Tax=Apiospora kogelbergensis TaxID=1337665 RepID=A0AAW0R705_9PEZI
MESPITQDKWNYSTEVSSEEARKTGCFTTLPIRIHRRNDIADEATLQSIRDWHQYVGDGWESRSGSAISPVGNWCAFIFPESLDDRLHSITYLANIGNIHDDAAEDLPLESALEEHKHFSDALNESVESLSGKETKTIKMKELVSQCVLQILALDRTMGMRMIESYRKKWLDVMEHPDYDAIQSLDQYLAFRMLNGGMEPFWLMCQFGMGLNISDEELQLVRHIFEPAESALVLTNDYWSWEREHNAWVTNGPRIVNSIEVLSRHRGISFDEARDVVRKMIAEYEAEYLKRKDAYIQNHPSLSSTLQKFIEVCGLVVAGNHYWCANCPRHHAWKKVISRNAIARDTGSIPPTVDVGADVSSSLDTNSLTPDDTERSSAVDVASATSATSVSDDSLELVRPTKKRRFEATSSDMNSLTRAHPVDAPCRYISSLPSKGVRTLFIDALNQWFKVRGETLDVVKDVTKMLHNASLILDDIQDASPLRRGKPATHAVFGLAQSINSSTYLFVQSVAAVHAHFDAATQTTFLEILQRMHVGQGYDLHWKFHSSCPSEQEYLEMVDGKTGAMFELIVTLMASKSSATAAKTVRGINFRRLTRLFGRFFQVRDDFMNISSELYAQGKGFCEDLDEEKLSFLLITCAKNDPGAFQQIMGIFRARSVSSSTPLAREAKTYILSLLEGSGTMEATRLWLVDLETQLEMEINDLEKLHGTQNSMLRVLLSMLSVKK